MRTLVRTRLLGPMALATLVLAALSNAIAAHSAATLCTGTITGTVEALVVPTGATCTATDLVVSGDVTVESGGFLRATGELRVGDDVTVEPEGGLRITAQIVEVGGGMSGRDTADFVVARQPFIGSHATIAGGVNVSGARTFALLDVSVEGNVIVRRSGAEGFEITSNEVHGNVVVIDNTIVGAETPSLFAVTDNSVDGNVIVSGNDATNAFEPPYVMSNTVSGNLVCQNNTPDVTDEFVDGTFPNTVAGHKIGECAGL
jgi:hypothetical protein